MVVLFKKLLKKNSGTKTNLKQLEIFGQNTQWHKIDRSDVIVFLIKHDALISMFLYLLVGVHACEGQYEHIITVCTDVALCVNIGVPIMFTKLT